jgi:PleD family two-component response regulator
MVLSDCTRWGGVAAGKRLIKAVETRARADEALHRPKHGGCNRCGQG